MDWWKRKKSRANEQKSPTYEQRSLIRGREGGAMLLEDLIECCDGKSNPIKILSADQISKATKNACKCSIPRRIPFICECTDVSELSYPRYRNWYSVMLDNHLLVERSGDSREVRDITISSMVSGHKNFMKLIGCCLETEISLLVYYGDKKQYSRVDLEMLVSWRKRMKIAGDIATALAYLHTAFPRPFLYCNMNLWNILLDQDGVAKLIDFSNCVSVPQGETFVKVSPSIWRAINYMDDDYVKNGVVSEKTDAFGFGILMQKLLMGEERFLQLYDWNSRSLSKSVRESRLDEIIDPNMLKNMGEFPEEARCQMDAFFVLAERCIGLSGEVPNMVQVAKELKRYLKGASSYPSRETLIGSSSVLLLNQKTPLNICMYGRRFTVPR